MLHIIYVYGTLRPKNKDLTAKNTETVEVPGYMYDLGWYPGAIIRAPDRTESSFIAEKIEVDDEKLKELDRYEGYYEDDPANSLYIRRPYLDGWIYEYNRPVDGAKIVESGDWLEYAAAKRERTKLCA